MGKLSDVFTTDRYRSWARHHASERSSTAYADGTPGTILPTHNSPDSPRGANTTETGGLDEKSDGRGSPAPQQGDVRAGGPRTAGGGGARRNGGGPEGSTTGNDADDAISRAAPPPAPPPHKSEDAGPGDSTVESAAANAPLAKPSIPQRMLAGSFRFVKHLWHALTYSWVNVLLVFVPIGIAADAAKLAPGIIFGMNAIAIIPLAGLLAHATESVASRLGDTLGALLNVSFGNAVELIIFIIALVKDEIEIVQASLLGSILANLLLILGMAFLFGGLRFREQVYNSTVTQMSACLLSLSVMSLLLPTAFHAAFNDNSVASADQQVLKVSRGTSVVLLVVYILYLLFQLKSHAYMYESTPQAIIDEESHPGVLADIMNSSSSSDSSSTSDSSDTDTSGSVINTGKKIKRVFKNRKRRKSSASTSSTTTSAIQSAISSPSFVSDQRSDQKSSYWDAHGESHQASRRRSALGVITSGDEADADHEDNSGIVPRIRDFVTEQHASPEGSKSPERKKHRRKHHHKKRFGKRRHHGERGGIETAAPEEEKQASAEPKVAFADEPQVMSAEEQSASPAQGKPSFNMRQLSSRANFPRPALPKVLSNNVFSQPAPQPQPISRPPAAPRSHSQASGAGLRRTSSLPDRLNQQASNTSGSRQIFTHSDPLPPFQHQRQQLRKVRSEVLSAVGSDDSEADAPEMSRTAAVMLLLISTALVAVCAEFMVDAIPDMLASAPGISQAFVGLIILPIVGNAAEHVTAVTVAAKNKMDLAIGVAVGSSIQIALFVTPIVVLLGWILQSEMSLYFNLFETISLFVTAFVVNFLVLDGRSNYLEGSLLIAAYIIIALGAFFYPNAAQQSSVGGGTG